MANLDRYLVGWERAGGELPDEYSQYSLEVCLTKESHLEEAGVATAYRAPGAGVEDLKHPRLCAGAPPG